MPKAYRIVKPRFVSSAFDGEGAQLFGGRWNEKGTRMVYTSTSASLAVLETFVHMGIDARTTDHVLIEIEIPDGIIEELSSEDLPTRWNFNPAPESCQDMGTKWAASKRSAVLSVPSVIMQIERNFLIDPEHPDFEKIVLCDAIPFVFDERMWKTK